ncbi:hypothetical protein Q4520_03880 [Alteromonas sp. 1_MG-2023]|uniref:hypothetical protein n=1 Tax=Alteromonas sp. 1_MG-2023 TaxID=3062669 RepID=UPI0026E144CB|nr:hypothetical protein [Alteromonas sp. 1_MG-2023]MDO6474543.1 hypothetical protein [Alteromonas sp. 1_MG-2023]
MKVFCLNALMQASLLTMLSVSTFAAEVTYPEGWIKPGETGTFEQSQTHSNASGKVKVLSEGQPVEMSGHPFFQALSENGRACISCHQPSDGMSLSAKTIQDVWSGTQGRDPIFAAWDGSNCPDMPQKDKASHSLLLDRGLFRIQMPWPPAPRYGKAVTPDFDIEVVRDPWGCNSSQKYGPDATEPSISVYRRPRPVANLKYLTAVGFAYDPKQGVALPRDEISGKFLSGNIMSDNRSVNLKAQMQDASGTHLEMLSALTDVQVEKIEGFILSIYAAQAEDKDAGKLDDGAFGGPELLRDSKPGQLGSIGRAVWSEFEPWEDQKNTGVTSEQADKRASIARGARLFREKMFLISDSAGINSPMGFGNPVLNSCVFCHNMSQMGNDVAPGQVDIGTTTKPFAEPAPELPLFRITCKGEPHPHYGRSFLTQDPGFGLVTGRCADTGKITLQSMRGLAARAPYFSNGSAKTMGDLVDYYDRRYQINFTEQERQDLINLMNSL